MHSVGRLVVPIIPSHPCYIPKFPFRVIAMCPLLPWILSGPPKTCTSLDGFHWICNWIWLLCVDYSTYHAYPIPKSPKALLCLYCNKNWPRSWLSWKASSWYRISYIFASTSPDLCKVTLGHRKHARQKVIAAEKGNLTIIWQLWRGNYVQFQFFCWVILSKRNVNLFA